MCCINRDQLFTVKHFDSASLLVAVSTLKQLTQLKPSGLCCALRSPGIFTARRTTLNDYETRPVPFFVHPAAFLADCAALPQTVSGQ